MSDEVEVVAEAPVKKIKKKKIIKKVVEADAEDGDVQIHVDPDDPDKKVSTKKIINEDGVEEEIITTVLKKKKVKKTEDGETKTKKRVSKSKQLVVEEGADDPLELAAGEATEVKVKKIKKKVKEVEVEVGGKEDGEKVVEGVATEKKVEESVKKESEDVTQEATEVKVKKVKKSSKSVKESSETDEAVKVSEVLEEKSEEKVEKIETKVTENETKNDEGEKKEIVTEVAKEEATKVEHSVVTTADNDQVKINEDTAAKVEVKTEEEIEKVEKAKTVEEVKEMKEENKVAKVEEKEAAVEKPTEVQVSEESKSKVTEPVKVEKTEETHIEPKVEEEKVAEKDEDIKEKKEVIQEESTGTKQKVEEKVEKSENKVEEIKDIEKVEDIEEVEKIKDIKEIEKVEDKKAEEPSEATKPVDTTIGEAVEKPNEVTKPVPTKEVTFEKTKDSVDDLLTKIQKNKDLKSKLEALQNDFDSSTTAIDASLEKDGDKRKIGYEYEIYEKAERKAGDPNAILSSANVLSAKSLIGNQLRLRDDLRTIRQEYGGLDAEIEHIISEIKHHSSRPRYYNNSLVLTANQTSKKHVPTGSSITGYTPYSSSFAPSLSAKPSLTPHDPSLLSSHYQTGGKSYGGSSTNSYKDLKSYSSYSPSYGKSSSYSTPSFSSKYGTNQYSYSSSKSALDPGKTSYKRYLNTGGTTAPKSRFKATLKY